MLLAHCHKSFRDLVDNLNNFKCYDPSYCCDKESSRRLKLFEYAVKVRNLSQS
mgnify:CR=1 FL=1